MAKDQVKGHLDLLLLQVVADQPAHGYQLVCALRERSGGAFDLPEGTVYPALHRLERQGLLAGTWDEQGPRRRRVYHVTPGGLAALRAERTEWTRFARAVHEVLGATS
jgi:PadR family transcriptional regulator, regulatory protein PadR